MESMKKKSFRFRSSSRSAIEQKLKLIMLKKYICIPFKHWRFAYVSFCGIMKLFIEFSSQRKADKTSPPFNEFKMTYH